MSIPPIQPVRDPGHSLFQSAVAACVRLQSAPTAGSAGVPGVANALAGATAPGPPSLVAAGPQGMADAFHAALGSSMVQAASAAAQSAVGGHDDRAAGQAAAANAVNIGLGAARAFVAEQPSVPSTPGAPSGDVAAAPLSKALGEAIAAGDVPQALGLLDKVRDVSDADTGGWAKSALTYGIYLILYGTPLYRDWTRDGRGELNYSVIDWKLPDNARVGILGDWGTNMDDARAVLTVLKEKKVDAVIHLGDVYYSGTPDECRQAGATLRDVLGPDIPVFTIPGNHEYYAFGHGFYPMLDALNAGIPGARQAASYFCLRTQDGAWQFLGMDTGYNDRVAGFPAAPSLVPSEVTWHHDKLDHFAGKTILLSHHQLFSASEEIPSGTRAWLNDELLGTFSGYFDRVAAWLWGHEHSLGLYADNLQGLRKGRLIGASGYEEALADHPYVPRYPAIPYLDPGQYQLDAAEGYYNHSYAVIDLGARKAPQDPVSITYYQYPSWGGTRQPYPAPPANEVVFTEALDAVPPAQAGGQTV